MVRKKVDPLTELRELAAREDALSQERERLDEFAKPVPPTAQYLEAAQAVLDAYDPRTYPLARHQFAAWRQALAEVNALSVVESIYNPEGVSWARYWRTRDEAHAALNRKPPKIRRRATPKEMLAAGATLRTVALEWRWRDEDTGEPDVDRVQRELDTPGSECTAAAIREREQFDRIALGLELSPTELAALEATPEPQPEPEGQPA